MTDSRPLRLCDLCGGLDDHPRHVTAVPAGTEGAVPSSDFLKSLPPGAPPSAIAELMAPTTIVRHLDCCAANGCGVCAATEKLTKGARGDDLLEAITGGALDDLNTQEL